jgi:hypothetical protein
VELKGERAAALGSLPAARGVAQIVGPGGRSLVIARPADVRRWAGRQLGLGPPPRKGARPALDLSPIARAVRHWSTTSAFHQRLVYERVMAAHVPARLRRDLKPPAWIRVGLGERFPRARVASGPPAPDAFGPFRDRAAASRAVEGLHRRLALRPCDYSFEPHPDLPLGLGCVYAQVGSCSAPCLRRIGEDAYAALAREAAALLARPEAREGWLPPWVGGARSRGVVVERGTAGVELYPVEAGRVLEEGRRDVEAGASTAAGLDWPSPEEGRDEDWAWLSAWLHAGRRSGEYLVVDESWSGETLAERVAAAVRGSGIPAARGPSGDNVSPSA